MLMPLSRRALFAGAAALLASRAKGETPGMIIRQKEPENLEFPFDTLSSFITANNQFYVRSHFAVPKIDAGQWRLRVEGAVARPFEISYTELTQMRTAKVTATLECAGNSRVFLVPQTTGAQWELGAVSNAEWTGVPLAALLEKAGVEPGAIEVALEGADQGEIRTDPRPPGQIHFARSISLAKAMQPNVVLAHRMNGEDLPASHGFPVRAVVPGYYGMASTKWLTNIRVVKEPFSSHWQSIDYAYWERSSGNPIRRPLLDMRVKSLIARPAMREMVKRGVPYKVVGAAWTGDADITKVEVSIDGGKNWGTAALTGQATRFAWRFWEYTWNPTTTGRFVLMSRATDSLGKIQAAQHDQDTGNYAIHHTLPIDVDVS